VYLRRIFLIVIVDHFSINDQISNVN